MAACTVVVAALEEDARAVGGGDVRKRCARWPARGAWRACELGKMRQRTHPRDRAAELAMPEFAPTLIR
nr:unnamed protein product [Digitaria exilis]